MPNRDDETHMNIKSVVEILFITLCGSSAILFILFTIQQSEPHDFGVFYYSAKAALDGKSIYDSYGSYGLPYWYFPWLAWFFIPAAFLPHNISYGIYIMASIVVAFVTINFLLKRFVSNVRFPEIVFVFLMVLVVCWLLFRVGQMDFILLATAVLMIYLISKNKSQIAALMVPILLFKPHLFILFLPAALLKGKTAFFRSATLVCLLIILVSFLVISDWPQQMLHMLDKSGQRTDNNWNFVTLPNMIGLQENWAGTANLPFTLLLVAVGGIALWKLREFETFPFLALSLAASLFCAPRAYAYNLPLLVPAAIWVSANLSRPYRLLFWLITAILPFFFRFSSGTYLIVLTVFVLGLLKARQELSRTGPTFQAVEAK
jgi:hypothetical protein